MITDKYRKKYFELGLCTSCCQKRQPDDNGTLIRCGKCRTIKNKADKELKEYRIKNGLCARKGCKKEDNKRQNCSQCRKQLTKFKKNRAMNGFCSSCYNKKIDSNGSKTYCSDCLAKHNKRSKNKAIERALNHLCRKCGNQTFTKKKFCKKCLDKIGKQISKQMTSRAIKGQCKNCQNETWYQSSFCEYHFVRSRWFVYKLSEYSILKLLQKLKDSNLKCFYTGKELIPGRDCVIDHLNPRARFPELTNDPDNIVWCSTSANSYKKKLTYEEFIEYCKKNYNRSKIAKAVIGHLNQKDK